jgi:CRP/FNR family transcriptional regulator, anaerobic regulatory protein
MRTLPTTDNLIKYLQSYGVSPSDEDITELMKILKIRFFKKGETFLEIGQTSNEVYFMLKGIARSYYRLPNGTEKTYFIYHENSIFTDSVSFISQKPATEYLEAIEDMEVVAIEYEKVMDLFRKNHVLESIGRRISDTNFVFSQKRLRSMMNDDATVRYQKFKKYFGEYSTRIPQHIVASYLGITPQSLSRLKREIGEI